MSDALEGSSGMRSQLATFVSVIANIFFISTTCHSINLHIANFGYKKAKSALI